MTSQRLEAFSDAVFAILMTIMVLDLKVPHGETLAALGQLGPIFLGYILSFVYVAIYWNNHHHLFHTVETIAGGALWPNMHLLFWLSLLPFTTAWVGETGLSTVPVASYGVVLTMSAVAYHILVRSLVVKEGPDSKISKAVGGDFKGKASILLYGAAIVISGWLPLVSVLIYFGVATMWFVPDRRVERTLAQAD